MLSRRHFLTTLAATTALPVSALAQNSLSLRGLMAQVHVQETVREMIGMLNKRNGNSLVNGFASMLSARGDMQGVAKAVLQDRALGLNQAQLSMFSTSFTLYLAKKYAPGFTLVRGGTMEIVNTQEGDNFWAVETLGRGPDGRTAECIWMVAFKNGQPRIYNFFWNGTSMMRVERGFISSYYDQVNGDINQLSRFILS